MNDEPSGPSQVVVLDGVPPHSRGRMMAGPSGTRQPRLMVVRAIALCAVATLLSASVTFGEHATGARAEDYFDGVQGNMAIRTDPVTVPGVGFVHAAWLEHSTFDDDFVSIGTANSLGAGGPQGTCPDSYDPYWSIYVDWFLGGTYGCLTTNSNVYGVGANPSFEIYWTSCAGYSRFVMSMAYVPRACLLPWNPYWTAGDRIAVGLETTPWWLITEDYNIDAKWTNLRKNYSNLSGWYVFGNCEGYEVQNPNYQVQYVSNTACNTYLPPLD
jgi:hypothetical protein